MSSTVFNNLKIEEVVSKENPYSSDFVFRHLPSSSGVTFGNYLRRVLSQNISGIAPLGAKISDKNGPVRVEESVIGGLREVTPYFIINLKKIIIEEKKKKEGVFFLELKVENKKKEERIITAGDFQKDKDIEIKNPDLYLATLAAATDGKEIPKLEVNLYFQKNWGYREVDEQKKEHFSEEEDVIVFDTDYSPVKSGGVNFKVNPIIISQEKSEEELILSITTNGSIKPKNALNEALEIAQDFFRLTANSINQ